MINNADISKCTWSDRNKSDRQVKNDFNLLLGTVFFRPIQLNHFCHQDQIGNVLDIIFSNLLLERNRSQYAKDHAIASRCCAIYYA